MRKKDGQGCSARAGDRLGSGAGGGGPAQEPLRRCWRVWKGEDGEGCKGKKLLERNSQDHVVLKKTWGGKEVKEREVDR